jgi:FeS assembly SUF system regulator
VLRITMQTDYGIILLTRMAGEPERLFSAPELAGETELSPPMVSKILKLLAAEGVLVSQRGASGGYSLARPPEAISVAEVIAVLEGPIALTACIAHGPGDCEREPSCPTRGHWHRINEAIRRTLDGISLADIRRPPAQVISLSPLPARPATAH